MVFPSRRTNHSRPVLLVAPEGVVPPRHRSLNANHRLSISLALRARTLVAAWRSRTPWARIASASAVVAPSGTVPAVFGGSATFSVGLVGGPTFGTGCSTAGPPGALAGSGIPPVAGAPVRATMIGVVVVVVVVVVVDPVVGETALETAPTCITAPAALTPTGSMRVTV